MALAAQPWSLTRRWYFILLGTSHVTAQTWLRPQTVNVCIISKVQIVCKLTRRANRTGLTFIRACDRTCVRRGIQSRSPTDKHFHHIESDEIIRDSVYSSLSSFVSAQSFKDEHHVRTWAGNDPGLVALSYWSAVWRRGRSIMFSRHIIPLHEILDHPIWYGAHQGNGSIGDVQHVSP
jgi:hypothetical protein